MNWSNRINGKHNQKWNSVEPAKGHNKYTRPFVFSLYTESVAHIRTKITLICVISFQHDIVRSAAMAFCTQIRRRAVKPCSISMCSICAYLDFCSFYIYFILLSCSFHSCCRFISLCHFHCGHFAVMLFSSLRFAFPFCTLSAAATAAVAS